MPEMWPAQHQTGSLGINRGYLKKVVGLLLVPGKPSPGEWDAAEEARVLLAVESGLRDFYSPMLVLGSLDAWEWSFLKPTERLYTVANQQTIDLPPGFCAFDGPIHYPPSASVLGPEIAIVAEHIIHNKNTPGLVASSPRMGALRVKNPDDGGTRYELLLWPTPDAEYELICKYKANPELLRSDEDVPLGGQEHAQTILESCQAAAEVMLGKEGVHAKRFQERLAASVRRDMQNSAPDTLGVGRDTSDFAMDPYGHNNHGCSYNLVTYNDAIVD